VLGIGACVFMVTFTVSALIANHSKMISIKSKENR
jgi:hypothetical protein